MSGTGLQDKSLHQEDSRTNCTSRFSGCKKEIAPYLPQGASECLPLTISVQNCPNFNIVSLILTTTEFIDPIKGSEISSMFCNHPLLLVWID